MIFISRAQVLGWLTAAGAAAGLPGFALGGIITKHTGTALTTFIISFAVSTITLCYTLFYLTESFVPASPAPNNGPPIGLLQTASNAIASTLRPLSLLLPTWSDKTQTWNWRLTWIALGVFLDLFAVSYVPTAWFLYATAVFGLSPDETGASASLALTCKIGYLFVIFPLIQRLRPRFDKWYAVDSVILSEEGDGDQTKKSPSTRFDVVVAFGSIVYEAATLLLFCLARSKIQLILGELQRNRLLRCNVTS